MAQLNYYEIMERDVDDDSDETYIFKSYFDVVKEYSDLLCVNRNNKYINSSKSLIGLRQRAEEFNSAIIENKEINIDMLGPELTSDYLYMSGDIKWNLTYIIEEAIYWDNKITVSYMQMRYSFLDKHIKELCDSAPI